MVWRNPFDNKFEAELSFPLPEGGAVCGYAVDIEGKLVPGVMVTKEKARATFEAEVRKDRGGPAMIEQSVGNLFTTRINPFLPGGTRTIQVSFTQDLVYADSTPASQVHTIYRLPFTTSPCLASLSATMPSYFTPTISQGHQFVDEKTDTIATWRKQKNDLIGKFEFAFFGTCRSWALTNPLVITLAGSPLDSSIIYEHCDTDCISIAASVRGIPSASSASSTASSAWSSSKIGILWDASKSRGPATADREIELAALEKLLRHFTQQNRSVAFDFYSFNVAPDAAPTTFQAGQIHNLISKIRTSDGILYHGGTDYSKLEKLISSSASAFGSLFAPCQLWIVVTDGISTFGESQLPQLQAPVYILSAATAGDPALLRRWARQSNGKFFNLRTTDSSFDITTAFNDNSTNFLYATLGTVQLITDATRLEEEDKEVHPLQPSISVIPSMPKSIDDSTMRFYARLNFASNPKLKALLQSGSSLTSSNGPELTQLTLYFGTKATATVTHQRTFEFDLAQVLHLGIPKNTPISERAWAQGRLAEVQAMMDDLGKKDESEEKKLLEKEQIAVSKHFTLVTPNTSLIVLETLQQYLDHMICPPTALPDIYRQYNKRIAARIAEEESKRFEKTSRVHSWWQRRTKWADSMELVHTRQEQSALEVAGGAPNVSEYEIAFRTHGISETDYKANRQVLHLFEYGMEEMNELPITARDTFNQQWHFAPPDAKQWPSTGTGTPSNGMTKTVGTEVHVISGKDVPKNRSGDASWNSLFSAPIMHIHALPEPKSSSRRKDDAGESIGGSEDRIRDRTARFQTMQEKQDLMSPSSSSQRSQGDQERSIGNRDYGAIRSNDDNEISEGDGSIESIWFGALATGSSANLLGSLSSRGRSGRVSEAKKEEFKLEEAEEEEDAGGFSLGLFDEEKPAEMEKTKTKKKKEESKEVPKLQKPMPMGKKKMAKDLSSSITTTTTTAANFRSPSPIDELVDSSSFFYSPALNDVPELSLPESLPLGGIFDISGASSPAAAAASSSSWDMDEDLSWDNFGSGEGDFALPPEPPMDGEPAPVERESRSASPASLLSSIASSLSSSSKRAKSKPVAPAKNRAYAAAAPPPPPQPQSAPLAKPVVAPAAPASLERPVSTRVAQSARRSTGGKAPRSQETVMMMKESQEKGEAAPPMEQSRSRSRHSSIAAPAAPSSSSSSSSSSSYTETELRRSSRGKRSLAFAGDEQEEDAPAPRSKAMASPTTISHPLQLQPQEESIMQIQADMATVNETFRGLQSLVSEQASMLDSIENNISSASYEADSARREIARAEKHLSFASKKRAGMSLPFSNIAAAGGQLFSSLTTPLFAKADVPEPVTAIPTIGFNYSPPAASAPVYSAPPSSSFSYAYSSTVVRPASDDRKRALSAQKIQLPAQEPISISRPFDAPFKISDEYVHHQNSGCCDAGGGGGGGGGGGRPGPSYAASSGERFRSINKDVDEVRNQMAMNIDKVLSRGDNLETLVERSEDLTVQSQMFLNSASTLKRRMWWKNVRAFFLLCLGLGVIAMALYGLAWLSSWLSGTTVTRGFWEIALIAVFFVINFFCVIVFRQLEKLKNKTNQLQKKLILLQVFPVLLAITTIAFCSSEPNSWTRDITWVIYLCIHSLLAWQKHDDLNTVRDIGILALVLVAQSGHLYLIYLLGCWIGKPWILTIGWAIILGQGVLAIDSQAARQIFASTTLLFALTLGASYLWPIISYIFGVAFAVAKFPFQVTWRLATIAYGICGDIGWTWSIIGFILFSAGIGFIQEQRRQKQYQRMGHPNRPNKGTNLKRGNSKKNKPDTDSSNTNNTDTTLLTAATLLKESVKSYNTRAMTKSRKGKQPPQAYGTSQEQQIQPPEEEPSTTINVLPLPIGPALEVSSLQHSENDPDLSAVPVPNSPMMNQYDLVQFDRPRFAFVSATPDGTETRIMRFASQWFAPSTQSALALNSAKAEYEYLMKSSERIDPDTFTQNVQAVYKLACAFLDASDDLLALSALGNLAEIQLGKVQLVRAAAYKLEEKGRLQESEHLFRRILEMRGEEPQSYRDLALVLAKRQKYDECISLFDKILTRCKPDWDARFSQIEVVALMDLCGILPYMNQLEVASGFKIPYSVVPAAANPVAVDLRAVLCWDVDGLDLELQVQDPQGEILNSFSNQSSSGAMLSRDFTGGYGPVEFLARRAFEGFYAFRAKVRSPCTKAILGGEVTIRFTTYTNFGNPQLQTEESKVWRITPTKGQLINLATVGVFPSSPNRH